LKDLDCIGGDYPVGDLNMDRCVQLTDFGLLASRWRETGRTAYGWCAGADFDKSGAVGFGDLCMLAEHWLEGADQQPEEESA
jgi:hypothetical protein